ncbi:MAG: hypothetical protein HY512_02585 [Candidatus Aenigmarchaeota archaeon]|nr:hypothetical protein [Candidatus Aenigmarchaeota archaeon]
MNMLEGLGMDLEIGTVFCDGSTQEEMFDSLDPTNKNLNTGICLSGNKEDVEDCLKRPTLEDVYDILTFGKIARMCSGEAIVWIPDSAYKSTDFGWGNVRKSEAIDRVSDMYIALCGTLLPENRKVVKMSDIDFTDMIVRTEGVQNHVESFYGIPKEVLAGRPELRRALHLNALTMSILGFDIAQDTSRDILVVAGAEERHTVEIARRVLDMEDRTNKISLLSPVPMYGFENEKGIVDSMFNSSRDAILYVNCDPKENERKVLGLLESQPPALVNSWVYLLSRAAGLDFRGPSDIVEYLDTLRKSIYGGSRSKPILTGRRN